MLVTNHSEVRSGAPARKEETSMDLIRIDDNKLKIMLTPVDMQSYALDGNMDYTKDETRQAFRSIMSEARSRTGFDAEGNRVYVQLYPSRSGGCEMFVTKLGILCSADRAAEPSSAASGVAHAVTQPRARLLTAAEGGRSVAFAFTALEDLLRVCRRLYAQAFGGSSAAYHSEDRRYYLLLGETGGRRQPLLFDRAALSFLSEYGTQQNADAVRLYIREHGSPICERDAVARLARL